MDFLELPVEFVADEDLLQMVLLLEGQQTAPEVEELALHPEEEGAGHDNMQAGQAG